MYNNNMKWGREVLNICFHDVLAMFDIVNDYILRLSPENQISSGPDVRNRNKYIHHLLTIWRIDDTIVNSTCTVLNIHFNSICISHGVQR